MKSPINAEQARLDAKDAGKERWLRWGPYLSERQWGTVREDYSPDGSAWTSFSHEMARSRAYRWGEDGIGGISDDHQYLCFAIALWNGQDPFLKERLFGVTGPQGNHGEDVKELYYYLDATPTHSYLKMLYKYPQSAYPYEQLVAESAKRTRAEPEYELLDTGIFNEDRYFDVVIEYAKATPHDILIRVTAHNRGPEARDLHLLPTLWFRNMWSWEIDAKKPALYAEGTQIIAKHEKLGAYTLDIDGDPDLLFCDNESNAAKLWDAEESPAYPKDAINDYVVDGRTDAVNPEQVGTKAAAHYVANVPTGGSTSIRLRLAREPAREPFADFDQRFARAIEEAHVFYESLQRDLATDDEKNVQRQALAGMIWSKQHYQLEVSRWLHGDPGQPPPPAERLHGRNNDWLHLNNSDIISMPDKWEYPWYAAWDLAFHCVPLAMLDPQFAKKQLLTLTREWYMHPNGQLPAYEWCFSDVNPPVHAWATWKVYQQEKLRTGVGDRPFLERIFHKLLLNFTWWVNRKDVQGRNIFQGGFLGLDNIGVFDRSAPLPAGGFLSQCDGTSWMAMYSLNLLRIALELAIDNPIYQDLASKFFEHFLFIAAAMRNIGDESISMWSDEDEFFYDVLSLNDGRAFPLKVRSLVGLIPLLAVEVLDQETLDRVPEFTQRMQWFLKHRPELAGLVSRWEEPGRGQSHLLSLLRGHRMKCLLKRMLNPEEFLSDFGVRAMSRVHLEKPYVLQMDGMTATVRYAPAESDTNLFGGNSNWRGPIWFPTNYLLIESLRRFYDYYGPDFLVEHPTSSGAKATLREVADDLSRRLCRIFLRNDKGERAVYTGEEKLQHDPHFRDNVLFYEYFNGDTGRGLGASHQTGWTGLVAMLLQPTEVCLVDYAEPATAK